MRLAYRNAPSLSSFSSVSSFPSLPLWLAILCLASLSPFHPRVGSQAAGGCVGPPSWCVNNCFAHVKFLGSELLLDQFSGWVVRQRHQPRLHAGSGLIRHSKPLSFPLSSTLCTPTVATCLGTLPYHLTCTHPLPVHTTPNKYSGKCGAAANWKPPLSACSFGHMGFSHPTQQCTWTSENASSTTIVVYKLWSRLSRLERSRVLLHILCTGPFCLY